MSKNQFGAQAVAAALIGVGLFWATPGVAQNAPTGVLRAQGNQSVGVYSEFATVLRIEEVLSLLKEDGRLNAKGLHAELFRNHDDIVGSVVVWEQVVDRLYGDEQMSQRFQIGFMTKLQEIAAFQEAERAFSLTPEGAQAGRATGQGDIWLEAHVAKSRVGSVAPVTSDANFAPQIIGFYTSELGQKLFDMELAARRGFLNADTRQRAELERLRMRYADDAKWLRLRALMASTDMVDLNVMISFKSLEAFEVGLLQARGQGRYGLDAAQILALDARSEQLRTEAEDWLESYLLYAYADLSDAEWRQMSDFMKSDAGAAYQAAVFAGYQSAMIPVMRQLGCEAGWVLYGRKI